MIRKLVKYDFYTSLTPASSNDENVLSYCTKGGGKYRVYSCFSLTLFLLNKLPTELLKYHFGQLFYITEIHCVIKGSKNCCCLQSTLLKNCPVYVENLTKEVGKVFDNAMLLFFPRYIMQARLSSVIERYLQSHRIADTVI